MTTSSFTRSALLASLLLSGSALAGEPRFAPSAAAACTDPKAELLAVAKAQSLVLNEEEISSFSSAQSIVVATNIEGFEKIPDTAYAQGVDAAFLYIDSPEAGIPAGFYRVHVRANPEDIKVGKYQGTASLIDQDGKEVVKLAADIETFTLVAPKSGRIGLQAHVGLNEQMMNWNLTRFRQSVLLVLVRPWGTTVIDLFNNY